MNVTFQPRCPDCGRTWPPSEVEEAYAHVRQPGGCRILLTPDTVVLTPSNREPIVYTPRETSGQRRP